MIVVELFCNYKMLKNGCPVFVFTIAEDALKFAATRYRELVVHRVNVWRVDDGGYCELIHEFY